jgi:acetylornithine deacetylase/succinyl-diaminopimelate desuccinylase-like protein
MVLAKRYKLPLKRDLIFAAVADEESGGQYGSGWLVDNHPDQIRAEYAFGEIGGFNRSIDGKRFYPVQIAEKGICWLKITSRGEPGHGSLPNWQGAVGSIGRAASLLGSVRLPFHKTLEAQVFVQTMAKHQPLPKNRILLQVLNPRVSTFILEHVFPDKSMASSLYAMFHNTANPTVIHGGEKINVLPSEATLLVDGRTLPGQSLEDFLREIKAVIGKGYDVRVIQHMPAVSVSPKDPILGYIEDALRPHDPQAIVVPYMAPGFTDAKHYSRLGIRCFGFSPVQLPKNFNFVELMHGHDERIPVEGFRFGLRVLFDLVADLCT